MNKTLRNGLIGAAAVVALVLALPFLVPMDAYRDRIESAAAQATGRALHIEGPLRLMLFPQFGLRAEKVTFANMPGGHAAAMASVGDIKLAIHFLPLLSGRVELDQIVLDHPVIELEVDATGPLELAFRKEQARRRRQSTVTLPANTEFSGIKISDGRISYANDRTGAHRELDHVNANVAITRLDQPARRRRQSHAERPPGRFRRRDRDAQVSARRRHHRARSLADLRHHAGGLQGRPRPGRRAGRARCNSTPRPCAA